MKLPPGRTDVTAHIHVDFVRNDVCVDRIFALRDCKTSKINGGIDKIPRSQWQCGLSCGSWPVGCWDREFEFRSRHGFLSASFCVVLSCVGRCLATG
jgi:hypothetical protein